MKWQVKSKAPGAFLKQFPEYTPLIAQLLCNRDLRTQEAIDEFFNPDYQQDFHDPYLLKGMKKAVKRILKAVKKGEKITVYGDFDADGVCASVVLFLTLKKLGAKSINSYIPDREKENHGLNEGSVKKLAKEGTKLIIVVDCASTDFDEVKLANSLGLDVIIADHHEVNDKLPKALALINPLQKEDKYPFKRLSGTGVVYKLVSALLSSDEDKQDEPLKKWLLDLVALATVADMMPIIGENRTLVKYGLGVLAQTQIFGLRELMKVARIEPEVVQTSTNGEAPSTNLNASTLGFVLGPRLNAANRMDHANTAFRLLTTQDESEAGKLAIFLDKKNSERQSITSKIIQELENRLGEPDSKIIFEGDPDWPVGLLGLVSNKAREKYCRPAMIYTEIGDIIHVSCRSIPYFDLMEPIRKASSFMSDYGGHKGGAGFRAKKKNLEKIKKIFEEVAEEKIKDEDLIPILEIDAELALNDISWPNYDKIQEFAPFGRDNLEPKFLIKGLEIKDLRVVGNNGGHLKMDLICFDQNKAKNFKAIGFGLGEKKGGLKKGDCVDIVFEFILNEWNGTRNLELKVIDLKLTTLTTS